MNRHPANFASKNMVAGLGVLRKKSFRRKCQVGKGYNLNDKNLSNKRCHIANRKREYVFQLDKLG